MSRRLVVLLVGVVACAPPPVPPVEQSIQLLWPSHDTTELPLDADGVLSFLIVVDINGLKFVTPSDQNHDVDGEGHYHVTINDVYIDAPPHQYYQFTSPANEYAAGDGLSVRVSLQSNTHADLDSSPAWEDIVEYTVGAAP